MREFADLRGPSSHARALVPGAVDHARYGGFWFATAELSQMSAPNASALPGSTRFHSMFDSTRVTGSSASSVGAGSVIVPVVTSPPDTESVDGWIRLDVGWDSL